MIRRAVPRLALATCIVVAIGLAALAFVSLARPQFGQPPVSTSPDHGEAARQFGGTVGFTVDVTQIERANDELVLHLHFQNRSSEQQRANPADFQLEDSGGWHARAVFGTSCPDWGRVDLYPAGGASQPLRDPQGTRAGSTWDGILCFPEPPTEGRPITLVWEPDVAFGPLSVPIRIAIR